jgi:hypothetical protein
MALLTSQKLVKRPQKSKQPALKNLERNAHAVQQPHPTIALQKPQPSIELADRPQTSPSLETAIALHKDGKLAQATAALKQCKHHLSPQDYAIAKHDYLQAAKETKLGEEKSDLGPMGDRAFSRAEYKKFRHKERLHPGDQSEFNCAPQSAQQIIYEVTGIKLTEAEMAALVDNEEALARIRFYDPEDGMPSKQGHKILDFMGISSEPVYNMPEFIKPLLEECRGVISAHDDKLLWGIPKDTGQITGHAVLVAGLVKDKKGEVTHYIINDTHPVYGAQIRRVATEQFEASLLQDNDGIDYPATVTDEPLRFDPTLREYALAQREQIWAYMDEHPEVENRFLARNPNAITRSSSQEDAIATLDHALMSLNNSTEQSGGNENLSYINLDNIVLRFLAIQILEIKAMIGTT